MKRGASDTQRGDTSRRRTGALPADAEQVGACEDAVAGIGSTFAFVVSLDRLQGAVMGAPPFSLPEAARHHLFLGLVEKALQHFSQDVVLEVLAFIDGYYLKTRARSLDPAVHDYLTRVVNTPTLKGIRKLLASILSGRSNRYETVFDTDKDAAVLSCPRTWRQLEPTVEEEAAKLLQWVDSRCSDIDVHRAKQRVMSLFKEQREEGLKVGQQGFGDEDAMVTERMTVDLNCPLSATRIVIPACGKRSKHLQPFDLEHFLTVNLQRNRSLQDQGKQPQPWKCPVSNDELDKDSIVVDSYFADILDKVPSTVRFVTILKDGSWVAEQPPAELQTEESIRFIEVPDSPFNPKYDVQVKEEPKG